MRQKGATSKNLDASRRGRKPTAKESKASPRKEPESPDEWAEVQEWKRQYYQNKSILDLRGLGCGTYLLGTSMLPFQSPIDGTARIEIMSGTTGTGSGGVRICASDDYWPSQDPIMQPVFLVPFQHIEQTIVFGNRNSRPPKFKAYQILIILSAATGSSPLVRKVPEIVSFNYPDRKADELLQGAFGRSANTEKQTYLSTLKHVFNEQLAPFHKSVIDLSTPDPESTTFQSDTMIHFSGPEDLNEINFLGHLTFLPTGLLFVSTSLTTSLYLPLSSMIRTTLVVARNFGTPRPVGLSLLIETSEPYYAKPDTSKSKEKSNDGEEGTMLISFAKMPARLLDQMKEYGNKHNLKIRMWGQTFYDYAKNQMATGFEPLRDG